jgi:hypothetical protein
MLAAGGRQPLDNSVIVDDAAANDGQERSRALQLFIGNREAVSIKHRQVTVVPDLD